MTKRHFETAAEIVRDMYRDDVPGASGAETAFIRLFRRYNGRFDTQRFSDACHGRDSYDSAGRTVRYSRRGL